MVALGIAADRTDGLIGLGEMEADLAMADPLFGGADGVGELEGFFVGAAQQVMGEPLGGFGADSGQASQGRDQAIHGGGDSRSRPSSVSLVAGPRPPPRSGKRPGGRPPVMEASDWAAASRALASAGVDGRHDQVFQQLGVAIGDQLGIDMHRNDLEPAIHLDRHRPAAGITFHFDLPRTRAHFDRVAQLARRSASNPRAFPVD